MLLILLGSVSAYVYYLKEKNEQLETIKRGFCPKCRQKSILLADQKAGGCSEPKLLTFACQECDYTNSFVVENGNSCG